MMAFALRTLIVMAIDTFVLSPSRLARLPQIIADSAGYRRLPPGSAGCCRLNGIYGDSDAM